MTARTRSRLSRVQAARYLAHCNTQLLDPTISEERRGRLEEHVAIYRRELVGSCTDCGRTLEDQDQPGYALGLGPDCYRRRLDQGDADDRAHAAAVDHDLSHR